MRRGLARVALFATLACSKTDAPVAAAAADAEDDGARADAGLLSSFTFADASPSGDPPAVDAAAPTLAELAPYLSASPESAKAIGHTSVVFKLGLSGSLAAAFKPESKRGRVRYRGEIAAYRLSRALGLRNVPPALARSFDAKDLRAAASKNAKSLSLFDDEVIAHAGRVRGALMPWIDKLEFLPVETDPWRARWTKWLRASEPIPPVKDDASLAAQISTLVVFDTVTGNWDRWSGANVGFDKETKTLLFVDNDGAFFEPAPAAPLAAQLALLEKVDRYSKKLVAQLRALDPLSLADAIGEESPGEPLLGAKTLASVDERRRKVLSIVDAKVAALGEATVLAFE